MSYSTEYADCSKRAELGVKPMLEKNTEFVKSFWHRIDIKLAKNLLKIDTKRLFKGKII